MYRKPFIDMYLKNGFDFDEAKSEVDFALDILFNYTYKDFMLSKSLEDWQKIKLRKIIQQRVSSRKPIQQLLGQAYFFGRRFFVNEYTLIPRPETELLVKNVLELALNYNAPQILDIGSGTGCIALTCVLENDKLTADSVDISPQAIEMSKKNALFHNVLKRVNFFESDLFENINKKYDIIVSNPPYIPLKDKKNLQIEVKDFDPKLALFSKDEKGLEFYEKIISKAGGYLEDKGYVLFEMGFGQARDIKTLFEQYEFNTVKIEKDFNSIERVIVAQKK